MLVIGIILGGLAGAVFGSTFADIAAGALVGAAIGGVLKYADARSGKSGASAAAAAGVDARVAALEARVAGIEKALHRLVDGEAASVAEATASASERPSGVAAANESASEGPSGVATPTVAPTALPPGPGAPSVAPIEVRPIELPPPMPDYGRAAAPSTSSATADASDVAAPHAPTVDVPVGVQAAAGAPPPTHVPATHPLWRWITGGNVLARIGAVVLFIGVAFLARYAVEHVTVPIELRLAGIAALGLGLLLLGWRLRHSRRGYALTLQGTGVGVLYLTVFAALALYHLLPPALAFFLLLALVVEAGVLAVRQDALALAVLGALGGFAAPVLVSTGAGNHVVLFTFYALLDAGIFAIAWFRPWRALNLLGFLCTFVIATAWGVLRYRPEDFATTEPFLVLFFLLYVGIAVAYALRRSLEVRSPVDGMLVFGTPLVTAGLQASLVRPFEYGMSISALAMASVYIALAYLLQSRRRDGLQLLVDAFAALGLVFATLAVPLAVDARWTSATWALEGAALAWIGLRQRRFALRTFGLFLQVAAAAAFAHDMDLRWVVSAPEPTPILNSRFVGALLIAVAGLFTAWRYDAEGEARRPGERAVAAIALAWGLSWWIGAGLAEIARHASREHAVALAVGWLALTTATLLAGARALRFTLGRLPAVALVPALLAVALVDAAALAWQDGHLLAGLDALAWAAGLAVGLAALRTLERDAMPARLLAAAHVALVWLVFVVAAEEAAWLVRQASEVETWRLASWLLVPAILSIALCKWHAPARWPFQRWRGAQVGAGVGVTVLVLVAVALLANFAADGNAAPLPYVPLLNPLDLTFAAIALAAIVWWREVRALDDAYGMRFAWIGGAGAIAGLLWLTMSTVRVVHHFAGIPFRLDAAWQSGTVQAALALVWATTALAAMVLGNRRGSIAGWIGGAALLGIVVLKLLLVDLAQAGGIARIVSFIGVGLLLLLIGYLAPVPARRAEEAP